MQTEITKELRPCIINGKTKALFHTWEQRSEIIPPSPLKGGHTGGVIMCMYGICELEDGYIVRVQPVNIRFLDNKIKEYCFNEGDA